MESPEPEEFRLGFTTRRGTSGSGSGKGLAKQIVDAMCQAINRGLEDIEHFEELGVLVEGIDKDRISDLTCNLLKPEFIEYTQGICHSLGVEMERVAVDHSKYDQGRRRWLSDEHLLPIDANGKPIILIPKRFLRELPTLNAWAWVDEESLRDDLNIDISSNMKKAEIVALARQNPEAFRQWLRSRAGMEPEPYDVVRDPKLLVRWQSAARDAVAAEPLDHASSISTDQDLLIFVETIIEKFRHWAEQKGGWRVFWRDSSRRETIPEPSMQLLFLGVLDGYCEQAGITLDREVETGRGPVDFTFTGDQRVRVLVEMKKLSSGKFWNGLRIQTPIYMRSQEVEHAIFLAIRDSDTNEMRQRWRTMAEEATVVRNATALNVGVSGIDILPKDSASKSQL